KHRKAILEHGITPYHRVTYNFKTGDLD
ncbi:MAG TPA: ribonuclease HII, partial [Bacteroidales bacterium]|nr:ribonuclease HII [Bacteroidales bacterium]